MWSSTVKSILESRLFKVKDEDIFNLSQVVEEGKSSESLCNAIMDQISVALDIMFDTNSVSN